MREIDRLAIPKLTVIEQVHLTDRIILPGALFVQYRIVGSDEGSAVFGS